MSSETSLTLWNVQNSELNSVNEVERATTLTCVICSVWYQRNRHNRNAGCNHVSHCRLLPSKPKHLDAEQTHENMVKKRATVSC